ncbi:MAG: DUF1553 domain-containing protein [Bryobacteraceae bacterium]
MRLTALALIAANAFAVDFKRDIRPILSDNCFACHGPDEKQRMVNLRLDTHDGIFADRGGSKLIVPGNGAASRLYQRISAEKQAMRMPPPAATTSLTGKQIDLIKRWIDEGAKVEEHWSFTAPQRHEPPEVKRATWPRSTIDRFVLARLELEGLKPSAEADKATLLRRVTFDLTGLPPTPVDIQAFLADRSPKAYEKVVDRLLASPQYGERMTLEWLDQARYADTHGYHIDSHRDMWPWRDWVIAAFNGNMPFDRFVTEQLAGDLLPGATKDQRIATGFNRNHMINFEGGAIPEEYLTEYVVDRVETTSTVFMGLTMGCARCHDHKYDPLKQKEFYEFFAFFNTIAEKGLDGRTGNAEPRMTLPSGQQKALLEELTQAVKSKEKAVTEKEIAAQESEWARKRAATLPLPSRDGIAAHYEFDGHLADTSGLYGHAQAVRGEVTYGEGPVGRAATLSGETQLDLSGEAIGARPFSVALWLRSSSVKETAPLQKIADAATRRGFEIVLSDTAAVPDLKRAGYLIARLTNQWPANGLEVRTKERLLQNQWHHAAVIYDGSLKASGLQIYINGKRAEIEVVRDALSAPVETTARFSIGNKQFGLPFKGSIGDIRIYNRGLSDAELETLAIHWPVRSTIETIPAARRSRDQRDRIREYFLTYDAPEDLRKWNSDLKTLRAEKTALEKAILNTMVMEELEKPRDTFVLGRGDYRNKGDKVTPDVPDALPPFPEDAPRNRLGLARWLTGPSHPLTARVAVNRYWQMYFGAGLVKTAEDFGSQGEAPSHPELLDWLATEFVRTWDIKAMQRLIVTSATYRQASKASAELVERDPENRLLARGPRFRLPAETVRDSALAVSGLLNGKIGGASVFPYEPAGLWEDIAYGDVYSAQTYTPSHGSDVYRRSMYSFWKRTMPPASLATFDAPDREKCTVRRLRTNTPLQALVLMNDPTYIEAARVLAEKAIAQTGTPARINYLYKRVLARPPAAREARVLGALAVKQLASFKENRDAARKLLSLGESKPDSRTDQNELAAWTMVASAILNLDEAITKE